MLPSPSIIDIYVFSFVIAIGAVITPGPVSTAIVSQAPRLGWKTGPLMAAGHSVLEFAIVGLITFGLGNWLAQPSMQTAIALLGGLLLAFMGGSMLVGNLRGRIHLPGASGGGTVMTPRQVVGVGMLATITNPFWYAWWVTVAAGYLAQAKAFSVLAVSAFYLGHITADLAWDTTLSTVIGGGRRWITDGIYRGLLYACGIFLVYLAYVFLGQGLKTIL